MKMTKRIFIALLIASIVVSIFAFTASADEEVVVDYSYVLEYFEEPTLIYNDYTDGDFDYAPSLLVKRAKTLNAEYVTDENAPGGKYLSLGIASAENKLEVYTDNHVFVNWSSDTAVDDFILNMTVSGGKGTGREQNLPRIIIAVGDMEYTDASVGSEEGTTLAALDYKRGAFYYLKAAKDSNGATVGVETKTSFALEEGVWYDVSVSYNVDLGAATITITDSNDPMNTYSVDDAYVPYNLIKNVRVGAYGEDYGTARGSVIKLSSIYALGGLYQRNPNNKQTEVEAILSEMFETFNSEDISTEDMTAICELVKQVIAYGFATEDADVQLILDKLGNGIIGFYNGEMQLCAETYKDLPTYTEKRAFVNRCLDYINRINKMDLSDVDPELLRSIEENKEKIDRANNHLFDIMDHCYFFMEEVKNAKDCDLTNYPELVAYLANIEIYAPDPTYPGIEESYNFYVKMRESADSIKSSGTLFIDTVNVANNSELDINVRADAYRNLDTYYFDNETYPGVTEALATYYDVLIPGLGVEIDKADNFIKYVNKADYAVYISAKQENIDVALTYSDCDSTYKGVADSRILLENIQKFVDEQLKNANAYISAVNALDTLSGDALLSAIKNAQNLQNKGNVLGVDGVTEANIKLDEIIASIELRDKYCIYFVNSVAAIDKANTTEELYEALAKAKAAETDADPSYEGVKEASAKLASAISDYNKSVNEINSEFIKASEVAANTSGIGKTSNTIADRVIAFIKKIFDEE